MDILCQQCGRPSLSGEPACPGCGALLATVEHEDEVGRTILRPARVPDGPAAVLADGRRVPLRSRILLGRNPRQEDGVASLTVDDPDYTVSKTHVSVTLDGDIVWVTDLMSTNGVRLASPTGADLWLTPGEPARLWPGTRVHYGSQSFIVELAPGSSPRPVPPVSDADPDLTRTPAPATPTAALIAAVPMGGNAPVMDESTPPIARADPPTPVPPSAEPVRLPDPEVLCPSCGADVLADARFCVVCGRGIGPSAQVAEVLTHTGAGDPSPETTIGDIRVLAGQVVTPVGSVPLTGSVWTISEQVSDRTYIAQSTIVWAIVLSAFCGLGLLLLLKKEHELTGTAVVAVTSGQLHYGTTVQIASAEDLVALHREVASVREAAAR